VANNFRVRRVDPVNVRRMDFVEPSAYAEGFIVLEEEWTDET